MYIYLNRNQVIIDIVYDARYIKINEKNGCKVLTDNVSEAIAMLGSDNDTMYPLANKQLYQTYEDIFQSVCVEEVPCSVSAINYRYVNGEFILNTEYLPYGIAEAKTNSDAISELYDLYISLAGGV